MKVAVFRPPHAQNNTAFEIQRSMYRYMAGKYNINITIFTDEDHLFNDDQLTIIPLKRKRLPVLKRLYCRKSHNTQDHLFTYYGIPKILKQFDLIETSDPTLYYYAYDAYCSAKKHSVRLVCGSSVTLTNLVWIRGALSRRVMDYACRVSCCTPKALQRFELLGLLSRGSKKVIIMGHPFDTNFFKPCNKIARNDHIKILTVGRLSIEKGHHHLIEAVSRLISRYPNIRLSIVGKGTYREQLLELSNTLLPAGTVTFHGEISHERLPDFYNKCDLFALCSISTKQWEEYFGAVIGEAMSCGKPVIATKSGGIPFVVQDNKTGFLVKEGNVDEIAAKLKILIDNKNLREQMGQSARRHIMDKFSLERVAEQYYKFWTISTGK